MHIENTPFRVEQNGNGFLYVVDCNGKKLASVYGTDAIKFDNATLFADAPDMMEENFRLKAEIATLRNQTRDKNGSSN